MPPRNEERLPKKEEEEEKRRESDETNVDALKLPWPQEANGRMDRWTVESLMTNKYTMRAVGNERQAGKVLN